jgi:hypothetical protein
MWRRVELVWTNVSEERIFSIFRVEKSASEEPADWLSLQPPAHAASSLADLYTLNLEAIRSSETSVHIRSIRCHIPEGGIVHSHRCENLKSYILIFHVCITYFQANLSLVPTGPCIKPYWNIAHEVKSAGLKTICIWVGLEFKIIIQDTWVFKFFILISTLKLASEVEKDAVLRFHKSRPVVTI